MDGYWSHITRQRLSRRRAISLTAGAAAGAALLAACGGNDSGSSSSSSGSSGAPKDSSGLLYTLVDDNKNIKRGGRSVDSHPGVLSFHDPMKTGNQIRVARRGYSQFFRIPDGHLQLETSGGTQGDFLQSWEISPDKLTITGKMDPGAVFPPIAPVNSRPADTDDVLFSWNRLKTEGAAGKDLVNELNPASPILNITAPDKSTVVIKLKEPNAAIFSALGTDVLGTLYILPKEGADASKLDLVRKAVGTGPYYITESSEQSITWKRNPNFKRVALKDNEPYVDEIYEPIIVDQSTVTAQFRAGALYEGALLAQDVLPAKKDLPVLLMRATAPSTFTERLFFGQNPDSPFRDERIRVAAMRTIDRDAYIGAAYNTDKFAAEGLPVSASWEGPVSAGGWAGGWFLDPKSKDFGPNGKNYQNDIAEAKKLIEAAGQKTPLEFTMTYAAPGPTSFPPGYYTRAEIYMGAIENSGIFKMNRKLVQYASEWSSPAYRFSMGKFTGMTWGPDTAVGNPANVLFFAYNSKGGYFMGGDSAMDDMTNKIRAEFDDKKRLALVQDFQRYNAGKMFNEKIGVAGGFRVDWPVIRNMLVNTGGTNWMDVTTPSGLKAWLDPDQPPLKKA